MQVISSAVSSRLELPQSQKKDYGRKSTFFSGFIFRMIHDIDSNIGFDNYTSCFQSL